MTVVYSTPEDASTCAKKNDSDIQLVFIGKQINNVI
jgi:hypothetical protein